MMKLLSKTSTRLISQSQSHLSYSTTNLSAAPLSNLAPPTSTSLEPQSIPPATPPTKKKGGSTLWFMAGLITYGIAETLKHYQAEKTMTIFADRQQILEMEPRKLIRTKNMDKLGFRRVVFKGVFDERKSRLVGPKPKSMAKGSEKGFYVITPLLPILNEPNSVKSPILVNRGWVPLDWKESSLQSPKDDEDDVVAENESRKANKLLSYRQNPLPNFWYNFNKPRVAKDQVSKVKHEEVIGIVRKSEKPGIFVPANDPSSGKWFFIDVSELARAMGFGKDMIFVEKTNKDMDETRLFPVPRDVEDLIRSKPVSLEYFLYSFPWHCLSVACFSKSSSILMRRYMTGSK